MSDLQDTVEYHAGEISSDIDFNRVDCVAVSDRHDEALGAINALRGCAGDLALASLNEPFRKMMPTLSGEFAVAASEIEGSITTLAAYVDSIEAERDALLIILDKLKQNVHRFKLCPSGLPDGYGVYSTLARLREEAAIATPWRAPEGNAQGISDGNGDAVGSLLYREDDNYIVALVNAHTEIERHLVALRVMAVAAEDAIGECAEYPTLQSALNHAREVGAL